MEKTKVYIIFNGKNYDFESDNLKINYSYQAADATKEKSIESFKKFCIKDLNEIELIDCSACDFDYVLRKNIQELFYDLLYYGYTLKFALDQYEWLADINKELLNHLWSLETNKMEKF